MNIELRTFSNYDGFKTNILNIEADSYEELTNKVINLTIKNNVKLVDYYVL